MTDPQIIDAAVIATVQQNRQTPKETIARQLAPVIRVMEEMNLFTSGVGYRVGLKDGIDLAHGMALTEEGQKYDAGRLKALHAALRDALSPGDFLGLPVTLLVLGRVGCCLQDPGAEVLALASADFYERY